MMSGEHTVHIPVLRDEAIDALALQPGMTVVDATLGGGGYTRTLLEHVGRGGRVFACDADPQAIERFETQFPEEAARVTLLQCNYASVREVLRLRGVEQVDAIVADLGLSSDQIGSAERGFAFSLEGPIDMRLDTSQGETAATYIARTDVDELAAAFRTYGDERHAGRAARAIKSRWPLATTRELADVVADAIGRYERSARIHPATRVFQALRIVVNDEYRNLETFLTEGMDMLVAGGRMSIVTFHSGEDRIVKNIFRAYARGCICPPELPVCTCATVPVVSHIIRKPVLPSEEEVAGNPRARSAKLRAVEKC